MDVTELIREYAGYGLWANARFVERLGKEPAGTLDRPVKSSFPSLRATLLHIRDAECAWHLRIRGLPPRWPAEEATDIRTLLTHSAALHDRVRSLTAEDLQRTVHSTTRAGKPFSGRVLSLLMHTFNHSTFHRGQLVTMMRALGLEEVPNTDLLTYQRSLEQP